MIKFVSIYVWILISRVQSFVIKFDAMFQSFKFFLIIFFCSKLRKYLVDKSTSLKEGGVSQPFLFIHVDLKTSKIMYILVPLMCNRLQIWISQLCTPLKLLLPCDIWVTIRYNHYSYNLSTSQHICGVPVNKHFV